MALVSIKPLDGHGGYLRWKESVLLRLHTLGVARVLSEDRPAAAAAAAKKWAHDDAICGGHILHALSDRIFPDYARFATVADLWRALARTYDVDYNLRVWMDRLDAFEFDKGTGEVLLEQIAHAEALGLATKLAGADGYVADVVCEKLPEVMRSAIIRRSGPACETSMSLVWDVARCGRRLALNPSVYGRRRQ